MLKTTGMLEEELASYANPRNKIGRMVASGDLVPVRRGLYEPDSTVSGYCLAGCVYGPSYLSFEFALSWHGLIPERVYECTSATCGKRKTKTYESPFGRFSFRDVPLAVFRFEVLLVWEGGRPFWLASPEKALCDELYKLPPVTSMRMREVLLLDDLRIYEDDLLGLDHTKIGNLAQHYHCRSVSTLARLMERMTR